MTSIKSVKICLLNIIPLFVFKLNPSAENILKNWKKDSLGCWKMFQLKNKDQESMDSFIYAKNTIERDLHRWCLTFQIGFSDYLPKKAPMQALMNGSFVNPFTESNMKYNLKSLLNVVRVSLLKMLVSTWNLTSNKCNLTNVSFKVELYNLPVS